MSRGRRRGRGTLAAMSVRLTACCVLLLVLGTPAPRARAHFPHDPMAEVAIDRNGQRIVAQYMFPGRRLMVVSEDAGRSWAFVAPEASLEQLHSLRFIDDGVLVAADSISPHPWISEDGGFTWGALAEPDGSAVHWVEAADPATLFAGTADGVARSDDGGSGWTVLPGAPAAPARRVAVAPGWPEDTLVAAVGDDGLWLSDDGGLEWRSSIDPALVPGVVTLSPAFADDDSLWVGTRDGDVLFSDDRGHSWISVRPQPEAIGVLDEMIQDLLAVTDERLLAITASFAAICSDDRGASWAMCSEGLPARSSQFSSSWGHYRRLDQAADGPLDVVMGAWEGLVLSRDGGTSWEERCALQPTYVRAVGVSPGYPDDPTLWVGSYGAGVYVTHDGGVSWSVLDGLPYALHTEAVAVGAAWPDDPHMFVIGSRKLLVSSDRGATFHAVEFPAVQLMHQVVLAPDFASSGTVLATGTTTDEGHWGVVRSDDGGVTWEEVWLAGDPPAPQITKIAFSTSDSEVVYGAQREPAALVTSTDGGRSWEALALLPGDDEPVVLEVVAAGGRDRLLAVTGDGQVWSGESGQDIEQVAGLGTSVVWGGRGAGEGGSLLLSLDPPGLLSSVDGGETWEEIPVPFASVVLAASVTPQHPADATVVASTHYGTFTTCDGGEHWQLLDRMVRWEHGACDLRYAAQEPELLIGPGTGGAAAVMRSVGDAVEADFTGRAVRWLSWEGPAWGRADVWLDGEWVAEVDLGADIAVGPVTVFERTFDGDGFHQLRVEVTEARGGVVVDAVEVERHAVSNGPHELYEADDWCVDLPEWIEPADVSDLPDGCCASGRDDGTAQVQVGAVLALLGGVWRRRSRAR
jgi:hypothetical protein